MKKYFFIFAFISLLFTGCSQTKTQQTPINNPYEIAINDNLLSYYDTKDSVPKNFTILDTSSLDSQNTSNNVVINSDNQIRCITIIDSSITTYNQISVGDKINTIEDSFSFEFQNGNNYMVLFNDNTEENPTNSNKKDDWIWINYVTDNSQITQIQIYDVKYGSKMR